MWARRWRDPVRAASKYCDTYLRRREAQQFCLFLFFGGSLVLFFFPALLVSWRYATLYVGYPKFRRVRGICHVPSSIMPRACLFSGATLHPMFRPVRMSPPPSYPEIASLVELRCTPCFDRLGDFPCPLLPHALSLLVSRHYILHYTTLHPLFRQVQGFAPSSCPELMMTQWTPISKLFLS